MRFTNNPYEGFMKEKSYFKGVPPSLPPKGSRCDGCPYWRGIGCVFCYREQLKPPGNGRLVSKWCANYDRDCGCLPLDCECYMFGKCWTGAYCRYFREAVLPLDPALEAALLAEGPRPDFKACPVCGRAVAPDGRQTYCSAACAKAAHRRQQREYMRKKRG